MEIPKPLLPKLRKSSTIWVAVYAAVISFCTYSCMYAFRKPFSAATFGGEMYAGIDIKILFVIAQLVGYTLSKFLGIRIVSEIKHRSRAWAIIALISSSAVGLLLLPFVPAPYSILCFFINGIPLGMVWGLVFSYLEGRRATEFMGSVLAVSFIFSSGFVKSVGKWLMKDMGVAEYWMPFATAMIFFVPMLVAVFLLEQIPPPSREDEALRSPRLPMTGAERRDFISHFFPGIVVLVLTYVLLSVIRDFRDNFVADIWQELGFDDASVFTTTEAPVSVAILLCMSFIMLIKNNFRALQVNHYMVIVGFAIAGLSTYAFTHGFISPFYWMMLTGLGLYLGYIPFNVVFFERLIASSRRAANVGFLIYIADSFGYLGSIGVLLYKNFGHAKISYAGFFIEALYVVSITGIVLTAFSLLYFNRKISKQNHA
jgi:MFS family permease